MKKNLLDYEKKKKLPKTLVKNEVECVRSIGEVMV